MQKRLALWLTVLVLVIALPAACSSAAPANTASDQETEAAATAKLPTVTTATAEATVAETAETEASSKNAAETEATATEANSESAAEATQEPAAAEATGAETLYESAIPILLDGSSIEVNGEGATVDGSTVTITQAGTYEVSGTLDDGQIHVDAGNDDVVRIVLNGASISNSTTAPISAMNAGRFVVVLPAGTESYLSDAETYVYADPEEDEPDAALFSKADLVFEGDGKLTVDGNYNDSISSKDGLVITSGVFQVNSVGDGIRGKDYLEIENGEFTVNSGGDSLKSNEDEDPELGYIAIKNGVFNLAAATDGIQAETTLSILDGDFTIVTGGGVGTPVAEEDSAKALKADVAIEISGGVFDINAAEDGLNSNETLVIDGGDFTIACGDDAMHSDLYLTINNGKIDITESVEGIEGAIIIINDGDISVVASDDGINVSGDNNPEETGPGGGMGGPPGSSTEVTAIPTGEPESVTESSLQYMLINGGNIFVSAEGDGLDANGSIEMSDGFVLVAGPTRSDNGALDYDETFNMLGGTLVAAGSAGMAQTPSTTSSQPSVSIGFDSVLTAGTVVHVQTAAGETLFTLAPVKDFQSIVYSSPLLETGVEYEIYVGGSTTGEMVDGFTMEGDYTPGELFDTFTMEGVITSVGTTGMQGGPGGGAPGGTPPTRP